MDRREFVSAATVGLGYGLVATGCGGAASHPFEVELPETQPLQGLAPPLSERAAAAGLLYGAAIGTHRLRTDHAFRAAIAQECSVIVPEGSMKWGVLRPDGDSFRFATADRLAAFAQQHRIALRGHTLVWHHRLPQWVGKTLNTANAERHLLRHISTVVRRYAGAIHSWDVVNEAIAPEDGEPMGMRRSLWYELLGPDYVELAFRAAAEADPGAILVYNEMGLDYDIPEHEGRRAGVLKLMERLVSRGVPVHAVGVQAHLNGAEKRFDGVRLQTFLHRLAEMGLDIYITELDVADQGLPANVDERDRAVAAVYTEYLDVVLEVPAVKAVLTWGLSDRYTWLKNVAPRSDGQPLRPLPLDADLNRKPAWQAISDAFERRARVMSANR